MKFKYTCTGRDYIKHIISIKDTTITLLAIILVEPLYSRHHWGPWPLSRVPLYIIVAVLQVIHGSSIEMIIIWHNKSEGMMQ